MAVVFNGVIVNCSVVILTGDLFRCYAVAHFGVTDFIKLGTIDDFARLIATDMNDVTFACRDILTFSDRDVTICRFLALAAVRRTVMLDGAVCAIAIDNFVVLAFVILFVFNNGSRNTAFHGITVWRVIGAGLFGRRFVGTGVPDIPSTIRTETCTGIRFIDEHTPPDRITNFIADDALDTFNSVVVTGFEPTIRFIARWRKFSTDVFFYLWAGRRVERTLLRTDNERRDFGAAGTTSQVGAKNVSITGFVSVKFTVSTRVVRFFI